MRIIMIEPVAGRYELDLPSHRRLLGRWLCHAVHLRLRAVAAVCRHRPWLECGRHFVRLVTNESGGNLEMVSQLKDTQSFAVIQGDGPSDDDMDGTVVKLHLVLDQRSHARLVSLQGALRAASVAEVLRRALDAYELFDPEDLAPAEEGVDDDRAAAAAMSTVEVKHLYVDISKEMKKQLNDEKAAHGRTQRETISRALAVLMQLVRNRAKLVADMKKGEINAQEHKDGLGSVCPSLLASV